MNGHGSRGRPFFSAWLTGPAAVVLGLGAHLAAGGAAPAVPILAALTALLSLSASILSRLKMPGWVVFLLCGLAQQLLHLAYSALSGAPAGEAALGHGHDPAPVPVSGRSSGAPAGDLHLMVHAHVAAALLTMLLISKREAVTAWIRAARARAAGPPSSAIAGEKDASS